MIISRGGSPPLQKSPLLDELADRYEELGVTWDALAEATLPAGVYLFHRFRELTVERAELTLSGGANGLSRLKEIADELTELEATAAAEFPLTADGCDGLLADLQSRMLELHRD